MEYTRVHTKDETTVRPLLKGFFLPSTNSHKGQNGKVMVIGGSSLFHSAVLWSAEIASYFADMVHVASTNENNEIISSIKKKWRNGIVIQQKDIESYLEEDDSVLLGTGMMRQEKSAVKGDDAGLALQELLLAPDEGEKTYYLTRYLLSKYPSKKWVIDAGALQMMEKEWLKGMVSKPVLTPHQKEFHSLFGIDIHNFSKEQKVETVSRTAKEFKCVILLKAVYDIVSDGETTFVIEGGNAGLTKGGTGDILAGLTLALYAKNPPLLSAVLASYLLKKTSDLLFPKKGFWYNNSDIISQIPTSLINLYSSYPGLTDP